MRSRYNSIAITISWWWVETGRSIRVEDRNDGTSVRWIVPTAIPLADLKARDLEECVYWLFDALGAKDLEWRTGGSGGGAADGGRDLEATFFVPAPDGEMEAERWWIECKGRRDTLEAEAVKNAIVNAAPAGLASLVIVTNTTFTNPTRDWVKSWQAVNPRPRIKLWDKDVLERQLSRHPSVALRLFAEALSTAGQLEALRERFWNRLEYTTPKTLQNIWTNKASLAIGPLERMALIINEFGHGSINARPWAGAAQPEEIFDTLQIGLLNLPYLFLRATRAGVDSSAIIRAFSHLLLATLQYARAEAIADHVLTLVREASGKAVPDHVVETLLMPILDRLGGEMQDLCSSDCDRFFSEPRTLLRDGDPLENYWRRLEQDGLPVDDQPTHYARLECTTKPCKVGFSLSGERTCSLYQVEPALDNVAEFLAIIERVSEFRLAQARTKRAAKSVG